MQEHFLRIAADTIAPILTVLIEVWPRANRAMVTNNWTVLTKVSANQNRANRGFPVLGYPSKY